MLYIFSRTLETVGTVFIAIAALRVHHRVLHEHKIDKQVFLTMQLEQKIGVVGVFFVVFGYILELLAFFS